MSVDDEFIDRILEGETSDEEVAEFQRWLNVPANLERFSLRAELHSDLLRSLRRRHIQKSALEASADGPVTDSASSREQLPSPVFRSRQMLVLTVTGLVTAACILIAFVQRDGNNNPDTPDAFAASVVSDVNGLLTQEGRQWDDAKLPVGGYELQKGLLNLQFGGGVMVYVEAPARFYAVSDKRVVLHSGRLSAIVPPEGIGFTVETPEAEVVDFGTEFSVDVEGGASEVHVFDGLVRVHPGASNQRGVSKSVDLQASQAVRITDGAAEPVDISIATDRFIRTFDEPKRKYHRWVKGLSPVAYFRMPIRDKGLVSDPRGYTGVVLTGAGNRPPHASGFYAGGSLRILADSTGRGGRVDSPPAIRSGQFTLAVFVYLESQAPGGTVATNISGDEGNFAMSLGQNGSVQATVRNDVGELQNLSSDGLLPLRAWRQLVMTVDGKQLRIYEDGQLVVSSPCTPLADRDAESLWFGTDAGGQKLWNGRIDEVALFDRALSSAEIRDLYGAAVEEME